MNILLVEPYYKRKYPPLGLMKISTYHKRRGDQVIYRRGGWMGLDFDPSLIYITTLFSWDLEVCVDTINSYRHRYPDAEIMVGGVLASLQPQIIEERTGIKPHVGFLEHVDNCPPDYSLFPELKDSIVFTSRGCPKRCPFCAVQYLEGTNVTVIRNWKEHIDPAKKRVIVQDNNILATPKGHLEDVVGYLKQLGKTVDFNSGLDYRLAPEWKMELLSQLKIGPVRLAFDDLGNEDLFEDTMKWIRANMTNNYRHIVVYVIYNYKDTFEEAMYRAERIKSLGGTPFAMPYVPFDWFSRERYVSPNWTRQQVIDFGRYWNRPWIWRTSSYEKYINTTRQ